eukprot:3846982-Prymnesium_polylepis.2
MLPPSVLLAGCAALLVPTRLAVRPAVARRAAVLVMDEEAESYLVPFNVTAAVAEIKEMLAEEDFSDAETAAQYAPYGAIEVLSDAEAAGKAAWLAKAYGERPSSTGEAAAAPAMTEEVAALTDEKNELDAALEYGYDAEKVKRLAEVRHARSNQILRGCIRRPRSAAESFGLIRDCAGRSHARRGCQRRTGDDAPL